MRLPPHLGLTASAWSDLPLDRALAAMSDLTALAEVYSGDGHDLTLAHNRRAVAASGLRVSVHGPFVELDPGSRSERRRREAVDAHARQIEAAAEVGALVYVVHPDFSVAPRRRDPRVSAALQHSIEDLAALQAEFGVRVAIENLPGADHTHFATPGELDLGDLGLVLDTGHAVISGSLHDFLAQPRAELVHVHLHDNRGPADADDPHRALGEGVVDVPRVLACARAAGASVVLELLEQRTVRDSLAYIERRGLAWV
jgi:sugar phosphate isomerase/epimerase